MKLIYPLTSELITFYVSLCRSLKNLLIERFGINVLQCRTITLLGLAPADQKSREIAEELEVSPSALTAAASYLEGRGLLVRSDDANDRRIVRISLTSEGEELFQGVERLIVDLVGDWLVPLSEREREIHLSGARKLLCARSKMLPEKEGRFLPYVAYVDGLFQCDSLLAESLEGSALRQNEFRVLFELVEHPHGMRAGALSKALLLRLTEITRVCDSLAQRDLVLRSRDTADRRSTRLEITSDGFALVSEVAPRVDKAFATGYAVGEEERSAFLLSARTAVQRQRGRFDG